MAAEYSRELGVKVYNGQRRLSELGFKMGGLAGYGLRRMLVSAEGQFKGVLAPGVSKSFSTDRVILVPGPPREQKVVRSIFVAALAGKKSMAIASQLNDAQVPYIDGRPWKWWNVREVLRNPKYAGCSAWGRTSQRLHGGTVCLPFDQWVKRPQAFKPLVSMEDFQRVQAGLADKFTYSDEEMLEKLRQLLARHKKVSQRMIGRGWQMPSPQQYSRRFGSLKRAYELIGYEQNVADFAPSEQRRHSERLRDEIAWRLQAECPTRVAVLRRNLKCRPHLLVDDNIQVYVLVCPAITTFGGRLRWVFYPHTKERSPITLACTLCEENRSIYRLYVVTRTLRRRVLRNEDFEAGLQVRSLSDFPDAVCRMFAMR